MAAEVLARAGVEVTIYDQMPSVGRKFLLAGRGGLNLTHSEDLAQFLTRYGEIDPLLRVAIEAFPPAALRAWSDSLGQPTFVGSSGRVFPTALKTSPLLRTWLLRLGNLGVKIKLRHRWEGFDEDGHPRFVAGGKGISVVPDVIVLALGGASWARLGSDARWAEILDHAQNCGGAAAARQLRFHRRLVRRVARFRRPSAQTHRPDVRRPNRARRSHDHPRRPRRWRGLRAVFDYSRCHPQEWRGDLDDRSAAGCGYGQARGTPVGTAQQAVAVEFPAQGGASVAGGFVAAARKRDGER